MVTGQVFRPSQLSSLPEKSDTDSLQLFAFQSDPPREERTDFFQKYDSNQEGFWKVFLIFTNDEDGERERE